MTSISISYYIKKQGLTDSVDSTELRKVLDKFSTLEESDDSLTPDIIDVVDAIYSIGQGGKIGNSINEMVKSSPFWDEISERYEESINTIQGLTSKKHNGDYQCDRCKNYSAIVDIKQTRSGDEASTVILICTECNFRKKL